MMLPGGFVDLRMHRKQQGDEGFWPSFTDIMTVILMIFLLAMLTLLIRNIDLVNQLRASLLAEQQTSTALASTSSQNNALHQRIRELESEVAMMRMRLMDMGEEQDRLQTQLKQSQGLNVQYQTLQQQWQQTKLVLDSQLRDVYAQLTQSQRNQHNLQQQLSESRQIYAELQQRSGLQADDLLRLQNEYVTLEKKYQKLVRPARSMAGKYVVQVRYRKVNNVLQVEIKTPKQKQYQQVSGIEMHKQLDMIKQQHPNDLYVKIVFPEDSGLSYNEAWNLTESLLRMYDYYYQEN